jgi:hypothetical protein
MRVHHFAALLGFGATAINHIWHSFYQTIHLAGEVEGDGSAEKLPSVGMDC